MQVTTVGLDLAKNIFHVHGVTETGEVAFNRPLRRAQVLAFFERLPPCLIGIEACASSHHWGRELTKLGHTVRLMPPMYVKPYVKRGKSDAVDAEAICEAVTRPTMRFVEIKSEDQQALLSLHRARDFVVRQRTQLINMLRSRPRSSGSPSLGASRGPSILRKGSSRASSPGSPSSPRTFCGSSAVSWSSSTTAFAGTRSRCVSRLVSAARRNSCRAFPELGRSPPRPWPPRSDRVTSSRVGGNLRRGLV